MTNVMPQYIHQIFQVPKKSHRSFDIAVVIIRRDHKARKLIGAFLYKSSNDHGCMYVLRSCFPLIALAYNSNRALWLDIG